MSDSFDVIVIGGGPAGYPAAIRAAQNKLSVACIDEWKNRDGSSAFGGTCLNAGCIPSKALLESTELYHRAQHEFAAHGVKIDGLGFDVVRDAEAQGRHRPADDAGHPWAVQGGGCHAAGGPRTSPAWPQGRVHGQRWRKAHAPGETRRTRVRFRADAASRCRLRRQADRGFMGRARVSPRCPSACA